MWDDEDNNPYGSFHRRGSEGSDIQSTGERFNRPSTPPSGNSSPEHQPHFISRPSDLSDEELDDERPPGPKIEPPKGGYDSRIQQILYEHPELEIQIVNAGKNSEGGGSYIAYTIRTGDLEVRRRYSEFASLRQTLVNLHPTLIIPPIPEKHSLADYAAKPTKAKEDAGIIELRQRMLATFLNRCRRLKQVREDGVWWRFLDPNASWNEVLHSHPAASIPKNNLKAPPLDPSNPTEAHQWLPVPSQSAKLRSGSVSSTGTPVSPTAQSTIPSAASHSTPHIQYARFPQKDRDLPEEEMDPYFALFESNTKDLEMLLTGSMEKANQRLLRHVYSLGEDLADLGARYNAFSLSEQSASVAHAIEKTGQACDYTYIASRDMGHALSAGFAEPMRESAQFAGVVRSVLRYRVLKRVQEEMTREELEKKRNTLDQLERSEAEAKRIDQYMVSSGIQNTPRRSGSSGSTRDRRNREEDNTSVDSDFPPGVTAQGVPSAQQGAPSEAPYASPPTSPDNNAHRRGTSTSGGSGGVANKLFGRLSHAIQGVTDSDPERARRDALGKTKESLGQLEQAVLVAEKDVKDASRGVMEDLRRFQADKEKDLQNYLLNFARGHIEWSKRSMQEWQNAKTEISKIEVR